MLPGDREGRGGLYRSVVLVREKKHTVAHQKKHICRHKGIWSGKERKETKSMHITLTTLLT